MYKDFDIQLGGQEKKKRSFCSSYFCHLLMIIYTYPLKTIIISILLE